MPLSMSLEGTRRDLQYQRGRVRDPEVEIGRMARGGSTQRMSSTITMTPENRPEVRHMVRYRDEERKLSRLKADRLEIVRVEKGDISDRYYPEDTVEDVDWNIDDSYPQIRA